MKLKSSQTTRGNEKKKPPFLAFHFLSSLSSTRGVKASQEKRAGGRGERDAWRRSSTRLGGGEGKKKRKKETNPADYGDGQTAESRDLISPGVTLRLMAYFTNRKRLCARSQRTRLFVEFIHVKRLPNHLTPGLIQGTAQKETRGHEVWLYSGAGGQKSSPYIGRHVYPDKIKEVAGGGKNARREVANFW